MVEEKFGDQPIWGPFFSGRMWEVNVAHLGHKHHLCDLAKRGEITLEQMKDLVNNPKFICKKCGRAAAKEENLCQPVPL